MIRLLISGALYLAGNAIGLLVATMILPGFSINFSSFIVATLIFTAVEVFAGPFLTKVSIKSVPALQGGVALVTTFVGLYITSKLVDGMVIGGISNWLAATLLVWVGSLIASLILPIFAYKKVKQKWQESK
ncbi:MAG: phage holin family protein [Desulfobulbia bacterium]